VPVTFNSCEVIGHRIDVVFGGLALEERLQFLELFGILGRHVGGEADILPPVVELPDVLVERHDLFGLDDGHAVQAMARAGPPAVVVHGTAAGQLEILRRVPVLRLCIVEPIYHAHAVHRFLDDAVDNLRRGHADGFKDRWGDVDEVSELRAQAALVLDVRRPGDRNGRAATPTRGHEFAITVWPVRSIGPGNRIAAVRFRAAEVVHVLGHLVERLRDQVCIGQLVHYAVQTAFGSRAVVSSL
jgi:hypothetical protein